jgi:hypothetical protein
MGAHVHSWVRRRDGRECADPDCGRREYGEAAAAGVPHRHNFLPWITFHHAPVGPYPEHTSFTVLLCASCGAWSCWPASNYALVTDSFRQLLERTATEAGFFLAHELETHFVEPSQV